MGINIYSLQEKRLVDHLRSLKVRGEVIEKRRMESSGGQPERKIVIVKFKTRIIETQLDDSKFEQTEIGEQIWFSPPAPDRDPCSCHLFVLLIVVIIAGALAIWAITSNFNGRTATLLSLAAAGWFSVIGWAWICSHQKRKCRRDLENEIKFFETGSNCEQKDQE